MESELSILNGPKLIRELLRRRPEALRSLAFTRPEAEIRGEFADILELGRKGRVEISFAKERGESRGGISAYVQPLAPVSMEKILANQDSAPLIIGLDGVTDPQNFGAILRLADAVGAKGVFTSKDRSCPLSDVVRKVSSGASEFVYVSYVNNLAATIRYLKKKGYWIVGSGLTPEALDLYSCKIPDPTCLLLGSEGQGLRRLSLELCDLIVKIPMSGTVQSLNVSQAGSIMAFEIVRKFREEGQKL
jgi:23S rRNA (guanosine2251-2'-O)-methyltransferase